MTRSHTREKERCATYKDASTPRAIYQLVLKRLASNVSDLLSVADGCADFYDCGRLVSSDRLKQRGGRLRYAPARDYCNLTIDHQRYHRNYFACSNSRGCFCKACPVHQRTAIWQLLAYRVTPQLCLLVDRAVVDSVEG